MHVMFPCRCMAHDESQAANPLTASHSLHWQSECGAAPISPKIVTGSTVITAWIGACRLPIDGCLKRRLALSDHNAALGCSP